MNANNNHNQNNNNGIVTSTEISMELLLESTKQSASSRNYIKEFQDQNQSSFLTPYTTTSSLSAVAITATSTTAPDMDVASTTACGGGDNNNNSNGNSNTDDRLKFLSTSLNSSPFSKLFSSSTEMSIM